MAKRGIPVFVKSHDMDTETQLTSGSAFITGNVIGTGPSSSSASANFSAFILMAGYASREDAGHISVCRTRTFTKSVGFCKTNSTVSIMAMHSYYIQ
jgi:hypothetical protein